MTKTKKMKKEKGQKGKAVEKRLKVPKKREDRVFLWALYDGRPLRIGPFVSFAAATRYAERNFVSDVEWTTSREEYATVLGPGWDSLSRWESGGTYVGRY